MKFGRAFILSFKSVKRKVSIPEFDITDAAISGRPTLLGCYNRPASFITLRTEATIAIARASRTT